MKCSLKQRRIFTTLFLIGYIFVVFFAQQFHDHGHPSGAPESNKTIVKLSHDTTSDCLVCHFLHEVKYLSYSGENYNYFIPNQYSKIEVVHNWTIPILRTESLCLRGPPFVV